MTTSSTSYSPHPICHDCNYNMQRTWSTIQPITQLGNIHQMHIKSFMQSIVNSPSHRNYKYHNQCITIGSKHKISRFLMDASSYHTYCSLDSRSITRVQVNRQASTILLHINQAQCFKRARSPFQDDVYIIYIPTASKAWLCIILQGQYWQYCFPNATYRRPTLKGKFDCLNSLWSPSAVQHPPLGAVSSSLIISNSCTTGCVPHDIRMQIWYGHEQTLQHQL